MCGDDVKLKRQDERLILKNQNKPLKDICGLCKGRGKADRNSHQNYFEILLGKVVWNFISPKCTKVLNFDLVGMIILKKKPLLLYNIEGVETY